MTDRFVSFLLAARWTCALVATAYHARFLLFVNYGAVEEKSTFSKAFYFVTGLGHEAYAVFFILDGILAGLLMRLRAMTGIDRAAIARHLGSLYRILLPTLIVGACFDLTGAQFFNGSAIYTSYPEFSALTLSYSSLLGNLLMLQPFIVPNFGSNSMLYLASYLFWSFVVLVVFIRTAGMTRPRGIIGAILAGSAVALMPYKFLIWAGIWFTGVAVVSLGESRRARPPLVLAIAVFGGTLVLSRLFGMNKEGLPPLLADVLAQAGFWLVGTGFALVGWTLYPKRVPGNQAQARHASLACAASGCAESWSGQTASFTFFGHFPVIMLLAGMGVALFDLPLMRQPSLASYAGFAGMIGACILTGALATRAFGFATGALLSATRSSLPETQ